MQYLSSFAPLNGTMHPAVMFFDERDNLPEFTEDTIDDTLRQARTVLGTKSQLNPIRGQLGDNYYLTFLKYIKPEGATYSSNTLAMMVRNTGELHHHTSNGGDSYRIGPTTYSTRAYPENRVPVLNPGGLTQIDYPPFQVYTSMYRSYQSWAYYYNGVDRLSKYSTVGLPVGTTSVQLHCMDITDDVVAAECLYQTNVNASNGNTRPVDNSGPVVYTSPDRLSETDEAINLSHALMIVATNVFMKILRGVDFEIEDGLEPGTRPYVTLVSTKTEL